MPQNEPKAKASELERGGQLQGAVDIYLDLAARQEGGSAAALWLRAADLQLTGNDLAGALESYSRALEHFSVAGQWNNALAVGLKRLDADAGNLDARLEVFHLALQQGYRQLARSLALDFLGQQHDELEAELDIESVQQLVVAFLDRFPDDVQFCREWAEALRRQHGDPRAVEVLTGFWTRSTQAGAASAADPIRTEIIRIMPAADPAPEAKPPTPGGPASNADESKLSIISPEPIGLDLSGDPGDLAALEIAPIDGLEPTHPEPAGSPTEHPLDPENLPLLDFARIPADRDPPVVGQLVVEDDAFPHLDRNLEPPGSEADRREAGQPVAEDDALPLLDRDLEPPESEADRREAGQPAAESDALPLLDRDLAPPESQADRREAGHPVAEGDALPLLDRDLESTGSEEDRSAEPPVGDYGPLPLLDPATTAIPSGVEPPAAAADAAIDTDESEAMEPLPLLGSYTEAVEESESPASQMIESRTGPPLSDPSQPPPQMPARGFEIDLEVIERDLQGISKHEVEPSDPVTHYDLGVAFKEMGLLEEAIAQLAAALSAGFNPFATLEVLGEILVGRGDNERAARVLRLVSAVDPSRDGELVGVLYWLGRSEESLGNDLQAQQILRRVVAADPSFKDASVRLQRSGTSRL